MTLEDFLALPEEKPALELIDGKVCQKPMAKYDHSTAQVGMVIALHEHPATAGGRIMTELGLNAPDAALPNHRVPDLAYFRSGRQLSKPYPSEPPDLAVEIRSEGQTVAQQLGRLAFLREQGTGCTILIDPITRTVHVHDHGHEWTAKSGETVTLGGLDGFTFAVAKLFE